MVYSTSEHALSMSMVYGTSEHFTHIVTKSYTLCSQVKHTLFQVIIFLSNAELDSLQVLFIKNVHTEVCIMLITCVLSVQQQ